ncbi:hypothetical protein [Taibaiella soli]|uniref:Uncharacterized protein n=1 Tax=Taibaiella soli TaxID=1649169 RepID=A0A2W2AL27_9BACT|nr:hypothetical protein [Taibaiella soli]PZF74282.1 hypothetical protein DN068_04545 [Taibaiella soli]
MITKQFYKLKLIGLAVQSFLVLIILTAFFTDRKAGFVLILLFALQLISFGVHWANRDQYTPFIGRKIYTWLLRSLQIILVLSLLCFIAGFIVPKAGPIFFVPLITTLISGIYWLLLLPLCYYVLSVVEVIYYRTTLEKEFPAQDISRKDA